MPGSHWLVTLTPENYAITRSMNFTFLGLRARQRKKAERVAAGDRVVYYVLEQRRFPATSTVTSAYFEDRHPIWINRERRDDPFPYRVHTHPTIVLEPWEELDASLLAPRLLYLKRWPLEQWFLALQGDMHLLSAQDFLLFEGEMVRLMETRRTRRVPRPRRPPPEVPVTERLRSPRAHPPLVRGGPGLGARPAGQREGRPAPTGQAP
jgi:hypothetical protein